ncbi:alpha/beta hydrolase [Mesorhizobium sp. WSM3879]|uniref:alpha/beta fold hydrolase n=1 Tax=Mesorhizobium sp. WSM3879 TaxID=2029406 RepID=UPI001FDFF464|nr:alpha/beta hydrolase [Mesorhizobium sp. WSM3879]
MGSICTSYCENGSGQPILFLHGAGFGADGKSSFVRRLNGLSDRLRVIAVDQLHIGETDYPPDLKYINRLGRVDHVIRFIEDLGLKQITLVGHSEEAFVATRIAIVRPDLVANLILLTASSTSPAFGDHRDEAWMQARRRAYDWSNPMPTEEEHVSPQREATGVFGGDVEEAEREAYRRAAARRQYSIFQSLSVEETDPRLYVMLQQRYIFPYLDRPSYADINYLV